jgi:prepilin-type N-terminal cleavage/methylation domain-containing protein
MKTKKFKWFTLVELIIVITILSILATIAFISFQSYTKNARDWVRISSLKSLDAWVRILIVKNWNTILPDKYLTITNYGYQWYVWDDLKRIINLNWKSTDPTDNTNYLYLTDANKIKTQFASYLENSPEISFKLNDVYADNIDYSSRFVYVIWDKIWVIVDGTKKPIQEVFTWSFDLSSYTWTLSSYCTNSLTITWTWWKLYNEWCSTYTSTSWNGSCILWTTFILWSCKLN